MIKWEKVEDFSSACKIIKAMSFEEYDEILHTSLNKLQIRFSKEANSKQVKLLKDATAHYCNLKKLDLVHRKRYGNPPKIRIKTFGGNKEYVEYWYLDKNKKEKHICGYPIKGAPYGFRCLRRAGAGSAHRGYGYCREHEMLQKAEQKSQIWTHLRDVHGNVDTLGELINKAEQTFQAIGKSIDTDIAYLEISRQAILKKLDQEPQNGINREMIGDLAYVSLTIAKVKALKVKTDSINSVPAEQVGAIILQVLEGVTKGESDEVRSRIATRAKDLMSYVVPKVGDEVEAKYESSSIKQALKVAGKYNPDEWPNAVDTEVSIPSYKKNHRLLRKDPEIEDE